MKNWYNKKISNKLAIEPYSSVNYIKITRSAYNENAGADFLASFDSLKQESSIATFGSKFIFQKKKILDW
jgi:hypothetical protein